MNTVFSRYAAALLPFFVLIVGASQTVLNHPLDASIDVPFGIIVLGAIASYIVALVPGVWQGRLKTGIAILTTILAALVPFLLPGGFHLSANWQIVVVAVLNALAVELGVQIRTAPVTTAVQNINIGK